MEYSFVINIEYYGSGLLRTNPVSSIVSDPKLTLDSSQRNHKIAIRSASGSCDECSGVVYSVNDDVVYSSLCMKPMSNDKNLEWL